MSEATAEPADVDSPATGAAESKPAGHDIVLPAQLADAMSQGWDPAVAMPHPAADSGVGRSASEHRAAVSAAFPGRTIVVSAGQWKTRANDTEYAFRPDSLFTWLTGETAAEAVLVMTPATDAKPATDPGPGLGLGLTDPPGHDATLYVREFAGAGEPAYFTDRTYGALWVGNVPSVADTATALDLTVKAITELPASLGDALTVRGVDPTVDARLTTQTTAQTTDQSTAEAPTPELPLKQVVDELRLVKTDWEIDRLQAACDATTRGFADVARELPAVLAAGGHRGERWLEGTFWRRARYEGNEVGYTSIVAAGQHGTTLHWWRNDGRIEPGQLLLADMGVESDELYTADVTRTMPVTGEWTAAQLRVYRAVLEAQEAGIAEVKAGADFLAAHRAAMWVLADHLHSWGILPVSAEISTGTDVSAPGVGAHRRYTLHSVSHMLGIDVHDCAAARDEVYRDGPLQTGMVLTVEPGLYFQPNDTTVPPELRGLAVRIEDDVVVTDGAPVNLSAALPRDPAEITAWMRESAASKGI